jgi:hypothetical protein
MVHLEPYKYHTEDNGEPVPNQIYPLNFLLKNCYDLSGNGQEF